MSMPIRCFSCNRVIGCFEEKYDTMIKSGLTPAEILETLNIKSYCCRRMFLGYVPIMDQLLLFPDAIKVGGKRDTEKND